MPKMKVGRDRDSRPPIEVREKISFDDIVSELEEHKRPVDADRLLAVHDFSRKMHADQVRRSGRPYLTHPIYVAYLLANLGFDETCVQVGLLHDVLEDTLTTREVLTKEFGAEIAELVDGVTKIGQHAYVGRDESQAETFRKLLLASARDIRVILVKLADRLHNMMTLEHMPAEARERIARETLEIYAPTAHRLGMSKVQGDLEDLAFFHLHPNQYSDLRLQLQEKIKHGKDATEKIRRRLIAVLAEGEIEAEISFRVKRLYSIFTKMRRQGIDASQLYDYLAFRIITSSIKDCYGSLGEVHQAWRPMPGRFKDYIAMPKPNLYQSLHTTLISDSGQPFEVQIRTREMDIIAEEGIAAHWSYKEGGDEGAEVDQGISWLRQVLEWQKEIEDPRAFLNSLKIDLYPDEVYVFTPKGDVMSFPRGATPLDFAYRVHTDLGHHCVGSRINGKLEPLRSELKNGDIVEILTNPSRYPSRDWLTFVRTSRAKNKKLEEYLESEGFARIDDLYAHIGFGKSSVGNVMKRVLSIDVLQAADESPGPIRRAVSKMLQFGSNAIVVHGSHDLLAYLAKCCSPVPGEPIVGYITRGRGVSVHSAECANVKNLLYNPEREIEVEWARKSDEVFPVLLVIETEDQPGMLARLTEVMAKHNSNIRQFEAGTEQSGRGLIEVVVEVEDRRHLEKLRQSIRAVPGVLEVGRRLGPASRLDGPSN